MKKDIRTLAALLIASATFVACTSDDSITDEPQQPAADAQQTYTMTIEATKGDGTTTRALSLDDNKLNAMWATTEHVYVQKGETWAGGSLQPQTAGTSTTLKGELSGITISTDDNLTLQFPRSGARDYSGQVGTLADIAAKYDYATASVEVASISPSGNINPKAATTTFTNQQAIIKFTLLDKANSAAISPSELTITDGTSTVSLTDIPASTYTTNGNGVLYVAFPAAGTANTITMAATVGSDEYTYEKSEATFTNGQYYSITVKMVKTMVPPTLTTGAVMLSGSGTTPNAATGKVTLTDAGNYGEANEIGLCWGTAQNPTIDNSHAAAAGHTVGTEYTVDMGTLEQGKTYYIRGYAKVGDNYYYADQVSEKTYHLISSLTDWNSFATLVNDGTDATAKAVQMGNISGVTTVVGNSESRPFKGSYNGQGYTISNVNISGTTHVGLFGVVNNASSVIENVVVASGKVYGSDRNVGAVVGQLNSGTVRYCANYAEVESGYNGQARIGGIVGWTRSSGGDNNHVSYCINYGYIHAKAYVGGVVGSYGGGFITYCQNYGLIEATGDHAAGGIAGWQSLKEFKLTNSHNGGNVKVSTGCGNTNYSNKSHYLIGTNHLGNPSINYPNNTYLDSLTVTIGSTAYTGSGLSQFEPTGGATSLTSNPAGITICGTTYSWNTPAPQN